MYGNLTKNLYKGIVVIKYNVQNLLLRIDFGRFSSITPFQIELD